MDIDKMNRAEMESAIICDTDDELYHGLDEQRFLGNGYSDDELRGILRGWILDAPDTEI